MEEHSSALKKFLQTNFVFDASNLHRPLAFQISYIFEFFLVTYAMSEIQNKPISCTKIIHTLRFHFKREFLYLFLEGCNTWSLDRKIYDPSQHTLEKKMEFMASISLIFFSIKCKKLDVYQQNVRFHQTNTRSKVFILHLNCFISFFIHYIWVILISNNPSLSIHFTTAFQRPYFNFTGQTYL